MHFQIKYQILDGAITQFNTADDIFTAVHFIDNMKKRWPNMLYQIAVISPLADLIIAGNTHKKL
jgi:hypothetical protein